MTDDEMPDGVAGEVDYAEMPRPEALKDLNDDEWNATPPTVRKAFVERMERSKSNHGEQIGRLTAKLDAMEQALAAREAAAAQNGNGHAKPKAAGIEGMELSELEAYHDKAEDILALARREPDNAQAQAEAAKLTPAVMRELMKAIARKAVGVSPADIEAMRAELRGRDEAARLTGALNNRVQNEFGAAAVLPGNAMRLSAEKAYSELQAAIKDGLTPEAALQYAAYKIAAGGNGNRDGRSGGADAAGGGRLAGARPDVAGVLRSLKSQSAALRAKGDELGAAKLDVEAELFGTMPDNILNNGR